MALTQDPKTWQEGFDAGERGKPSDSCPYPTSSPEGWSWQSGWIEGDAKRQGHPSEMELAKVKRSMDVWNAMTDEQRAALLQAANTAVPAHAMRHLGYDIPAELPPKDNAMEGKQTALRQSDPDAQERARTRMMLRRQEIQARGAMLPQIRADGVEALKRLLPIAQSDTGQSGVVARFLLNLYNGDRFPFDMTDFRRLDYEVFDDCMAVLKMDFQPEREVHRYFENGGAVWEQMAKDWNFKDFHGKNWRREDG